MLTAASVKAHQVYGEAEPEVAKRFKRVTMLMTAKTLQKTVMLIIWLKPSLIRKLQTTIDDEELHKLAHLILPWQNPRSAAAID